MFAWVRIPVHYCCGSEFLYPFFFIGVSVECGLKCRLQCALIALGQRKESERLLGAGDRKKHFCCAKYGSLVSLKHQLDNGAMIQRLRQEQEATGARDDWQFGWGTATVVQLKDSRSHVGESESGDTSIGVGLGEVSHHQVS